MCVVLGCVGCYGRLIDFINRPPGCLPPATDASPAAAVACRLNHHTHTYRWEEGEAKGKGKYEGPTLSIESPQPPPPSNDCIDSVVGRHGLVCGCIILDDDDEKGSVRTRAVCMHALSPKTTQHTLNSNSYKHPIIHNHTNHTAQGKPQEALCSVGAQWGGRRRGGCWALRWRGGVSDSTRDSIC